MRDGILGLLMILIWLTIPGLIFLVMRHIATDGRKRLGRSGRNDILDDDIFRDNEK